MYFNLYVLAGHKRRMWSEW